MLQNALLTEYARVLAEKALPFTKCKSCQFAYFYPRPFCPQCGSEDIEVRRSTGKGKIFALTRFEKNKQQVVYGIIEMEEGFRLYSNIIERIPGSIGSEATPSYVDERRLVFTT